LPETQSGAGRKACLNSYDVWHATPGRKIRKLWVADQLSFVFMGLKMKKLIGAKPAGYILITSYGLLIIFHILVLAQVVHPSIVWGGQVGGSPASARTLEIISLLLTLIFAFVVAAKMDLIMPGKFKGAITVGLWIIFAYLILNTAGNLASANSLEKLIFTPVTLIEAFLALRLAIEK
jgi:hypothetical protein